MGSGAAAIFDDMHAKGLVRAAKLNCDRVLTAQQHCLRLAAPRLRAGTAGDLSKLGSHDPNGRPWPS
jgi:hypothetical protein